MDRESLIVVTVANRLTKRSVLKHDDGSEWYVDEMFAPMFRAKNGHGLAGMMLSSPLFYTKPQLYKLQITTDSSLTILRRSL